jgi:hypothetical protein
VVGFPTRPVLGLILVGAALQVLSRFLVFDATSGNRAADSHLDTAPWLLFVALPLLAAVQLLIARRREAWAPGLCGGLIAGAALCQLDQTLAVSAAYLNPGVGASAGPGFWAAGLGSLVLLAATGVVLSGPRIHARPGLRSDWRAVVATLVVLGALLVRLQAFSGIWLGFTVNEPAVLLAAACLPLTVLGVNRVQRVLGLTAVTVFGPWVCAAHVYALIEQSFPRDAAAAGIGVVTALVSVAACWLAQAGTRRVPRVASGAGR